MTFDDFIEENKRFKYGVRNAWITFPGLSLYVRVSVRPHIDIDLANMSAQSPGRGALTSFLDRYEAGYSFCVECVHNKDLRKYLLRRGYTMYPVNYEREAPSFYKIKRK